MKVCRFCYLDENQKDLIVPCKCRGTIKYVHQSCLERWINISDRNSKCQICNNQYFYGFKNKAKFYFNFFSVLGYLFLIQCALYYNHYTLHQNP